MPPPSSWRMYLVARRGALSGLERGCELAGAAAVTCVHRFSRDERWEGAFAAWRDRPRKIMLRARGGQWDEVLRLEHALAGDDGGEAVLALPPRQPSRLDEPLDRMQTMTSDLGPARPGDEFVARATDAPPMTYLLNPSVTMSSGKTLAQVAHAAVLAAQRPELDWWARHGCRARVRVPPLDSFPALCRDPRVAARVVDAGLTEVAPGTVTVLALQTRERRG